MLAANLHKLGEVVFALQQLTNYTYITIITTIIYSYLNALGEVVFALQQLAYVYVYITIYIPY